MKTHVKGIAAVAALLVISGCASTPSGSNVPVMPGPNKPFAAFQQDQSVCQGYAGQQVQGEVNQANGAAVGTAVVGTLLGAGLGAIFGGGKGAAIGAGAGAVAGTAVGANGSAWSNLSIQQRYDVAYEQCMYARGNSVPGFTPNVYPLPPPPTGPVVTPVQPTGPTVTPAQ
jgi:hypothetical protein